MKKGSFNFFGKPVKQKAGLFNSVTFDPEKQIAVIRSSICTGEKVAGFKDKKDGHFIEIMLIRTSGDIEKFKQQYNVDEIRTEY